MEDFQPATTRSEIMARNVLQIALSYFDLLFFQPRIEIRGTCESVRACARCVRVLEGRDKQGSGPVMMAPLLFFFSYSSLAGKKQRAA